MNFYTNVSRYGNMLLYRGYENGKKISRRIKYKPTLYVSSSKGDWTTLDGKSCSPIQFESMRDAKEWIQTNKDTAGRQIFGNDRYISQFINEHFPGHIEFNRNLIIQLHQLLLRIILIIPIMFGVSVIIMQNNHI